MEDVQRLGDQANGLIAMVSRSCSISRVNPSVSGRGEAIVTQRYALFPNTPSPQYWGKECYSFSPSGIASALSFTHET